jgi:hypothetical protein
VTDHFDFFVQIDPGRAAIGTVAAIKPKSPAVPVVKRQRPNVPDPKQTSAAKGSALEERTAKGETA